MKINIDIIVKCEAPGCKLDALPAQVIACDGALRSYCEDHAEQFAQLMIRTFDDGGRLGRYIPGNGTEYWAAALPWKSRENVGALGSVDDGWLVVSGLTKKAALMAKEGYVVDSYVQEKLGGLDGDYPFFGILVRALVRRPG